MAEETKQTEEDTPKENPDSGTEPTGKTYTEAEYNALKEQLEQAKNGLKQAKEKEIADAQDSQQQDKARISQLETALEKAKLDAAIQVALLKSGALDTDYLAFKLQSVGDLTLDDHGNLTGWDSVLETLKSQYPAQFHQPEERKVIPQPLPKPDGNAPVTKEVFDKMTYKQRLELYNTDPETYKNLTGKKGE